jgi:D-alanyl-D-alanine carboxypeptidase
MAAFDLPSNGPVPQARYEEQQVASAYAAPSKRQGEAMKALTAVATPTPAPEYIPSEEVGRIERDDIDGVTTASTSGSLSAPAASGWVIQVGVSPNEKMAGQLLEKAKDKGGRVLSSAKPFTVAVNANGEQLYRARFSGFDGQKEAVNTCKALKKQGINCWASMQ